MAEAAQKAAALAATMRAIDQQLHYANSHDNIMTVIADHSLYIYIGDRLSHVCLKRVLVRSVVPAWFP